MGNELNVLESKVAQVAELCRKLRAENARLRQQLSAAEHDRKGLVERIGEARERLEQLASQLPADKAA